ncbi:MAG: hypothetical protein Q9169_008105 [Polycauliona sp. 2 TL-2023]
MTGAAEQEGTKGETKKSETKKIPLVDVGTGATFQIIVMVIFVEDSAILGAGNIFIGGGGKGSISALDPVHSSVVEGRASGFRNQSRMTRTRCVDHWPKGAISADTKEEPSQEGLGDEPEAVLKGRKIMLTRDVLWQDVLLWTKKVGSTGKGEEGTLESRYVDLASTPTIPRPFRGQNITLKSKPSASAGASIPLPLLGASDIKVSACRYS